MRLMTLTIGLMLSFSAYSQDLPPIPMTQQESADAQGADELGRRIYLHDQAAANATDLIQDKKLQPYVAPKGWITEEVSSGIKVTFVGLDSKNIPTPLYDVTISNSGFPVGDLSIIPRETQLTSEQLQLFSSRQLAMSQKLGFCSETYNTVTLKSGKGITVYLLPATSDSSRAPLGGSYRIDVTPNGLLQSTKPLTKSCIALENGRNVTALMVSHLLDSHPTELHVFWSLWAKKDIYIATVQNGNLWAVKEGKVELVKRGK